jgi:lambda family phage portal protein
MNKFLSRLADRFGFQPKIAKRNYAAAKINRLTNDWATVISSGDAEIKGDLKTLRARARELERNNDYARRYFKALENNVLGSTGIGLQMKSRDFSGNLDQQANKKIESAFADWGSKYNCCVDGCTTWIDVQRLALRSMARDGSVLIRFVRGYSNPYSLALQIIEADHLDHDFNDKTADGQVRFGVETDKFGKPVAYHILQRHPGDTHVLGYSANKRERIPASEVLHLFVKDRPGQTQGVPWLTSAISGLRMLEGYREAELVAARVSASKMGFYTETSPDGYVASDDGDGNLVYEAEPGSFERLPMGMDFKAVDFQHPNSAFGDFNKAVLRGVASGLGVSYNTLANDLEGVNYSSIRAGLLDEREEYKTHQSFIIDHLCRPVFFAWLEQALLTDALNLPAEKMDKFNAAEFRGRRWQWVDPLKDVQANITSIEAGLKSRRQVVSEMGGDFEDVIDELAEDQSLIEAAGIALGDAPIIEATDEPEDDDEKDQPSGKQSKPSKATKPATDEAPGNLAVAADAGLNGAQIQAALSVIEQIVTGLMPAAAGIELLISLGLDEATVAKMMSAIKTFKPKQTATNGSKQNGDE